MLRALATPSSDDGPQPAAPGELSSRVRLYSIALSAFRWYPDLAWSHLSHLTCGPWLDRHVRSLAVTAGAEYGCHNNWEDSTGAADAAMAARKYIDHAEACMDVVHVAGKGGKVRHLRASTSGGADTLPWLCVIVLGLSELA